LEGVPPLIEEQFEEDVLESPLGGIGRTPHPDVH
jgi:hypothetical protein